MYIKQFFCKFSRLPSYSNIQQTIYFHIQTQITFKNDGGFPFLCKQCEYVAVQMISRKLYNISFQIKSAFRHIWNYIKCNIQQHTRCLHRNGKKFKTTFYLEWNIIPVIPCWTFPFLKKVTVPLKLYCKCSAEVVFAIEVFVLFFTLFLNQIH